MQIFNSTTLISAYDSLIEIRNEQPPPGCRILAEEVKRPASRITETPHEARSLSQLFRTRSRARNHRLGWLRRHGYSFQFHVDGYASTCWSSCGSSRCRACDQGLCL